MEALQIISQSWPLAMVAIVLVVYMAYSLTVRRIVQHDQEIERLKEQIVRFERQANAIEHKG